MVKANLYYRQHNTKSKGVDIAHILNHLKLMILFGYLFPVKGNYSKWQRSLMVHIKEMKSPVNVNIVNDKGHCKVLHIN